LLAVAVVDRVGMTARVVAVVADIWKVQLQLMF
jgi:hypothetical protein